LLLFVRCCSFMWLFVSNLSIWYRTGGVRNL
jgi:hypothetical protein